MDAFFNIRHSPGTAAFLTPEIRIAGSTFEFLIVAKVLWAHAIDHNRPMEKA